MSGRSEFAAIVWQGRPVQVEYQWIAPERDTAPLVVFLHEGLGSVAMWRDFPQRLCDAGGLRGLVLSRPGYGRSTPPGARRNLGRGLHAQAGAGGAAGIP